MNDASKYPIQYVSIATGLKPHILRSWESRYTAICPERTETNRRLYSAGDIKRLQLLNRAISAGHSISQVASLSDEELIQLSEKGRQPSVLPIDQVERQFIENDPQSVIDDALDRVRHLDQAGLEKVLNNAVVNLSRSKYLRLVVQPLFAKIGELWAAGALKIIHERLATLVVRSQLLDMMRAVVLSESAPRLVVAAPVGQWHETGCLVVALTAAECGWRPMYFGPNLPAEEIAAAVRNTDSKIIALSVGHKIDPATAVSEIRKLNRYCGERAKIIVGGYGVPGLKPNLEQIGIRCITNAKDFTKELETS